MYLGGTAVQKAYLGSSLVWGGESYPETMWPGIHRLSYISSTSAGQYLQKNLTENIYTDEFKFVVDAFIPSSYMFEAGIFGSFCMNVYANSNGYICMRCNGSTTTTATVASNFKGKRIQITAQYGKLSIKTLDANGTVYNQGSVQTNTQGEKFLYIFGDGSNSYIGSGIQIYGINIYKNDVLYSSIIPVKNENDAVCFMDRLDNIWTDNRFIYANNYGSRTMSQYKYLVSNTNTVNTLIDINDGIIHYQYGNPDFKIQCGLFIPTAAQGDSKWGNIYGLRQDVTAYSGPGFNVEKHNTTNTIRFHYDMPDLFNQTLYPPAGAVDNIFGVDLEVEHTYKYFQVGSYRADNPNTITQTADTYDSFAIFGCIAANTKSPIRESGYKIVDYFKIFNGKQMVRNLVPFYDGNTNGLVDLYTLSTFYATQFRGAVGANTWVKDL